MFLQNLKCPVTWESRGAVLEFKTNFKTLTNAADDATARPAIADIKTTFCRNQGMLDGCVQLILRSYRSEAPDLIEACKYHIKEAINESDGGSIRDVLLDKDHGIFEITRDPKSVMFNKAIEHVVTYKRSSSDSCPLHKTNATAIKRVLMAAGGLEYKNGNIRGMRGIRIRPGFVRDTGYVYDKDKK